MAASLGEALLLHWASVMQADREPGVLAKAPGTCRGPWRVGTPRGDIASQLPPAALPVTGPAWLPAGACEPGEGA